MLIIILLPILINIAFLTIIERKVLAAFQRRIGPNIVGYYGILQPFSDALKLVVKEIVIPIDAIKIMFIISPFLSLVISLSGYAVVPLGFGLVPKFDFLDIELSILYTLALSSLGIYGVLYAGWSANSKYAFLGGIRSTAQIISYELSLSGSILIVVYIVGSFNYHLIINSQTSIWIIFTIFPVFIIFFISILAETNRTPFDLPEAESELVAGYFTEHSAIIFVFFFLAEYGSILLISTISAILWTGGFLNALIFLPLKASFFAFLFVWFRATLPRLRFDQLILFCWTGLIPIIFATIPLIISILTIL